jgi:hypothetical protein
MEQIKENLTYFHIFKKFIDNFFKVQGLYYKNLFVCDK